MGRTAMLLRCCCAALLWALVAAPAVAAPLLLDARTGQADAWPVVRMLVDASGQATAQDMLARRKEFAAPIGPRANLGLRPEAIWLLVPLRTDAQAPRRWVLSVDYASIDRIELYLPSAQGPGEPIRLGRELPFAQRPLPSAVHAATIELEPGRDLELLLRVTTRSTMALPITIWAPDAFHAAEARRQFLQGLMAGAMLCLLLYSLTQWVSLRDAMFLQYAVTIAGTGVFFVAYSGLGPQHLWGNSAWLSQHAAPLSVLVAIVGGSLFIERVLAVGELQPRLSRGLKLLAVAAGATALSYTLGLVDYRVAQRLATLFGPLPMLMAMPVAWKRARHGERIGLYMLAGWGAYGLSTLTMAALLRGWIDMTPWSEHAFQAGAMIEMAMWMRVLGVRIEELRASAQRAHVERDALRSLALTDALTGLPNRRGLSDVLARSLAECTPDRMTAVYLIDLDGFKPINDSLGHEAGDEVLVGVAQRLRSLLRASDTVARLGGDEFVVVASGLAGDGDAQALGRKLLDGFREPFVAAGQPCRVGLTIGYALAPLDGRGADELLRRADEAMYAGKQAGRDCLRRGRMAELASA
ncbi:MAG: diguanylate cyclase [Piscinibacter sp.]